MKYWFLLTILYVWFSLAENDIGINNALKTNAQKEVNQNEKLKEEYHNKLLENTKLQFELDKLKEKFADLQNQNKDTLDDKIGKIEKGKKKLQERETELEKQKSQNDELKNRIILKDQEILQLQGEVTRLKCELDSHKFHAGNDKQKIEKIKAKKDKLAESMEKKMQEQVGFIKQSKKEKRDLKEKFHQDKTKSQQEYEAEKNFGEQRFMKEKIELQNKFQKNHEDNLSLKQTEHNSQKEKMEKKLTNVKSQLKSEKIKQCYLQVLCAICIFLLFTLYYYYKQLLKDQDQKEETENASPVGSDSITSDSNQDTNTIENLARYKRRASKKKKKRNLRSTILVPRTTTRQTKSDHLSEASDHFLGIYHNETNDRFPENYYNKTNDRVRRSFRNETSDQLFGNVEIAEKAQKNKNKKPKKQKFTSAYYDAPESYHDRKSNKSVSDTIYHHDYNEYVCRY